MLRSLFLPFTKPQIKSQLRFVQLALLVFALPESCPPDSLFPQTHPILIPTHPRSPAYGGATMNHPDPDGSLPSQGIQLFICPSPLLDYKETCFVQLSILGLAPCLAQRRPSCWVHVGTDGCRLRLEGKTEVGSGR